MFGTSGYDKSVVSLSLSAAELEVVKNGQQFEIVEKNNIISANFGSQSIVSKLFTDTQANISCYDCPGFSNAQSLNQKITFSYFLNEVFTYASSKKLVFVIDYALLTDNAKWNDFEAYMNQLFLILEDIEQFRDGMAMTVRNVKHFQNEKPLERKDVYKNIESRFKQSGNSHSYC